MSPKKSNSPTIISSHPNNLLLYHYYCKLKTRTADDTFLSSRVQSKQMQATLSLLILLLNCFSFLVWKSLYFLVILTGTITMTSIWWEMKMIQCHAIKDNRTKTFHCSVCKCLTEMQLCSFLSIRISKNLTANQPFCAPRRTMIHSQWLP